MRLNGKVALVTGGSKGIGKAISIRLGQEGCKVAVNYFHDDQKALEVVNQIRAVGGEALAIKGDVSSACDVKRMVGQTVSNFGAVDILVNNARLDPYSRAEFVQPDETKAIRSGEWWDLNLDADLKSAFLLTWEVFDLMKSRGYGRIINVTSVQGQLGADLERLFPYSAAKAGMLGLTKSFAKAGAPYGITVNAIAPGTIETEMLMKRITPQQAADIRDSIPVRRFGKPEEVAEAVVFLTTVGFITGETININGGIYMP